VTGWRTALLVARREARRAKGRSILVVAMIMLPVAALASAAVYTDTFTLTPDERADRLMGTAQAVLARPMNGPVHQDPTDLDLFGPTGAVAPPADPAAAPTANELLALLPPGTRVIPDQTGPLQVRTAAGTGTVGARMLDSTDPLAHGILRQLTGRAPATRDEAALTPAAVRRLGADVGGSVRLGDGGRAFRVVGTVEDPSDLEATTVLLRAAALPAAALAESPAEGPRALRWLAATPGPMTWAQVKQLNTHGVVAVSRHVLAHSPGRAERYPEFAGEGGFAVGVPLLVGGLAMLEIVLLAGPAFAVGARRRRRALGLVAAAGGTPAHLRRIVLADGVVLGTAAAAAGVVLGIVAAAAARPLLEEQLTHVRSGGSGCSRRRWPAWPGWRWRPGRWPRWCPRGSPPGRTWSPRWRGGAASPGRGGAGWRSAPRWWRPARPCWPPVPGGAARRSSSPGWPSASSGWCCARPPWWGWWPGPAAGCRWPRGSPCATPPATAPLRHRRSRP
jgi:putative ABC transport system permease protein